MANSYCDWLQDTSLLVSERWPALDGGVRLDVRGVRRASPQPPPGRALTPPPRALCRASAQVTTVNDVVLYDVRTLAPYRAALESDDEVRSLDARAALRLAWLRSALTRCAVPAAARARQVRTLCQPADAAV